MANGLVGDEKEGGSGDWIERIGHDVSSEVGIDWIAGIGSSALFDGMLAVAERWFGGAMESRRGRDFYEMAYRWPDGVWLEWGHRNKCDSVRITFEGGALNRLSADDRVRVLWDVQSAGVRLSRIDVAVDFCAEDGSVDLVERMERACAAGQMCGGRRFDIRRGYKASGEATGATLYLGQRGKRGSGRFLRCYDKGLEQGDRPAGCWQRLEVEFTGDVAARLDVVGVEDVRFVSDDGLWWIDQACHGRLLGVALGAFEFREVVGDRHLKRRPVVEWWRRLCEGVVLKRVKAKRRLSKLPGYVAWLKHQVFGSVVRIGRETGRSMEDVIGWLVGPEDQLRASDQRSPAVAEAIAMWREFGSGDRQKKSQFCT